MTELSFTKQFLVALGSRPMKFDAQHVEDQHNYPARTPFTLPKPPKPLTKRPRLEPPPTVTIKIVTLRAPHINLTLPPLPVPTTTLLTVKLLLSESTSIDISKLKLLLNKRILPDITFLRELVPNGEETLTLNVMFMGGAVPKGAAVTTGVVSTPSLDASASDEKEEQKETSGGQEEAEKAPSAQKENTPAAGVLQTQEFWDELKGWLTQRVAGQEAGEDPEKLVELWREAWRNKAA